MDFTGKRVLHQKFGEGVIVTQESTRIYVLFKGKDEPTAFVYPSCFGPYLHFVDPSSEAEVKKVQDKHKQDNHNPGQKSGIASYSFTKYRLNRPDKNVDVETFSSEEGFYAAYKQALSSEMTYLRNNGGKRQRIYDGQFIRQRASRYIYTFEAEDELNLPDGTLINIWQGEDSVEGTIVECEGFTITLSSSVHLGTEVSSLEFSAEPWRLINVLIERLTEMSHNYYPIVHSLICEGEDNIDHKSNKIAVGQPRAVEMALSQPITFVWGPPGTGKTQTLAKIALEHIKKGNRVLMLSYSNVSVDGAVMRVNELSKDKAPGIIVRYGYAKRKDLLDHEYLTSYNLTIHEFPALLQKRNQLTEERKHTSRRSSRYVEIGRELSQIKATLSNEEKRLVSKAQFVATTVSKAVVDSLIYDNLFDVVIFDEASMAYIPQIVYSSSLARKHFICMGDFRQLPPIVQNDSNSILNGDIFQYCGITNAVDSGKEHKWLCMLDEQYRMHPEIASFSSKTMYNGLLRSFNGMEAQRTAIVQRYPFFGVPIGLADLSGMMSVCTKSGDNSRFNILSAFMTFSLAAIASKHYEAGIITPYHAQSRLLHAMSRDFAEYMPKRHSISCATVHQFQGSEKPMVLYDAVDCYRMRFPGTLLTSTANNYANRLFNVALTRAKGKFIAVANIDYFNHKKLSDGLMFRRLLDEYRKNNSYMNSKSLIQLGKDAETTNILVLDGYNAHVKARDDIIAAKKEICIDIPGHIKDSSFLTVFIKDLKDAKKRGVTVRVRAEKRSFLPIRVAEMAIENPFICNPVMIIDKKMVWYGIPDSADEFVSDGRTIPTDQYPFIRFEGKHTALSLYGFLEMSKTTDHGAETILDEKGNAVTETFSSYVVAHKQCKICGKSMKLQKSKKGKFFLACSAYPTCKNTELVDVDLVEQYFYRHGGYGQRCPKCGRSLEAKLGPYGIYVQCCGLMAHKYKLDQI